MIAATRAEFCQRIGIPVSTLDYYRRREAKRSSRQQHLIRISVETPQAPLTESRFTLILTNGRRIETAARFDEAALTLASLTPSMRRLSPFLFLPTPRSFHLVPKELPHNQHP